MRCYLQLESLLPNNFNQPITTEILKIELNKPTVQFIYITELQISLYTTVKVCFEFGKFAYTVICMRNVYTLI
jgi:hypothetical protein